MLRVKGRRPDGGIGFQATWRWHLVLRVEGTSVVLADDYGEVLARFSSDGHIRADGAPGLPIASVDLTEWAGQGKVQVDGYGATLLVPAYTQGEPLIRLLPGDGGARVESGTGKLLATASAEHGLRATRKGGTGLRRIGFFGDADA